MFEQLFKNIDDILRKDAGCSSELDYTEQTSWVIFLKYLEDFEQDRKEKCKIDGKPYQPILKKPYQWSQWAAPKNKKGEIDYDHALTGDALLKFVNNKLFPYLQKFKNDDTPSNSLAYKIGEIFSEIKNKLHNGYSLRDVLDTVDKLRFRSSQEKHELSHLYEAKIKNMGNAGRNGGEYYTPRPLIRAMIKVIQPKIGETIYDGAAGSAGFLCEAFEYLYHHSGRISAKNKRFLQENTFFAKEKKSLAYIIAIMNMILHGIDSPNVIHTNTLAENIMDIQPSDQYDIILANPPFGGKERKEIQQNFPIKTGETAFLFLQHFIKSLKPGGRAAVVIKNTFLSNADNAAIALRRELLSTCNCHTILDCPAKTFIGAGVKTIVLFFTKGQSTKSIWYYQLNPGRSLGKTNPLNDEDLQAFITLQKTQKNSDDSWLVNVNSIDTETYDLSVRNPNANSEKPLRKPEEILAEIDQLDQQNVSVIEKLRELIT